METLKTNQLADGQGSLTLDTATSIRRNSMSNNRAGLKSELSPLAAKFSQISTLFVYLIELRTFPVSLKGSSFLFFMPIPELPTSVLVRLLRVTK